jgi:para-aminobenzoate synthetase component 1
MTYPYGSKGSVEVTELCGIYSFMQVHQMISTVTSKLDPQYGVIDALKTTFPMGSMTGAPKISAMKIIDPRE